jgi:hypothetical protein
MTTVSRIVLDIKAKLPSTPHDKVPNLLLSINGKKIFRLPCLCSDHLFKFEGDRQKQAKLKKAVWDCGIYDDILQYLTKTDFDVMKNGWRMLEGICDLLVSVSKESTEADGSFRKVPLTSIVEFN